MKPGDSPVWVVLNFAADGRLECLRCGRNYAINQPAPVDIWIAIIDTFCGMHRHCSEPPKTRGDRPEDFVPAPDSRSVYEEASPMNVRLVTRDGTPVTTVDMPPFVLLPEVVVWGTRTFQRQTPGSLVYVEVMAWAAPVATE